MAQAVQKAAGDVSDAQKTLQSGGRVVATPTPTPSPPPTLNINIPGLGGSQAQQNGASMSTPSTTNSYPAYTGQSTQVRLPSLASSIDFYLVIHDTDEVALICGEDSSIAEPLQRVPETPRRHRGRADAGGCSSLALQPCQEIKLWRQELSYKYCMSQASSRLSCGHLTCRAHRR